MGGHEGHRTPARLAEGQYGYFIEIGSSQNQFSSALMHRSSIVVFIVKGTKCHGWTLFSRF
jgi:hypothetical protein